MTDANDNDSEPINIGLDDGYAYTKLALADGRLPVIPSRARVGRANVTWLNEAQHKIAEYETEATRYAAGEIDGEPTYFDGYPFSGLNRVIVQHGMQQAKLGGYSVHAVSGLPVSAFYLYATTRARYAERKGQLEQRRARFLAAWKRGVRLVGERCFDITAANVDRATDKDQLRPSWGYVEIHLLDRSRVEAAFLAALCSFFNSHWGQALLERAGYPNLCDLAGTLDAERSAIVTELFLNYQGW